LFAFVFAVHLSMCLCGHTVGVLVGDRGVKRERGKGREG